MTPREDWASKKVNKSARTLLGCRVVGATTAATILRNAHRRDVRVVEKHLKECQELSRQNDQQYLKDAWQARIAGLADILRNLKEGRT